MKYMQINETGYTPCGKWRVVPSEYLESLTVPTPPAELMLSGEPVGYVFEDWVGATTLANIQDGYFTVPLYLHPAPDVATVRDADRYRWLRDDEYELPSRILRMIRDGEPDLDTAIDAARGVR